MRSLVLLFVLASTCFSPSFAPLPRKVKVELRRLEEEKDTRMRLENSATVFAVRHKQLIENYKSWIAEFTILLELLGRIQGIIYKNPNFHPIEFFLNRYMLYGASFWKPVELKYFSKLKPEALSLNSDLITLDPVKEYIDKIYTEKLIEDIKNYGRSEREFENALVEACNNFQNEVKIAVSKNNSIGFQDMPFFIKTAFIHSYIHFPSFRRSMENFDSYPVVETPPHPSQDEVPDKISGTASDYLKILDQIYNMDQISQFHPMAKQVILTMKVYEKKIEMLNFAFNYPQG